MSSIKPVFFVGRTACPLTQPGFQKKVRRVCKCNMSSIEQCRVVLKNASRVIQVSQPVKPC